jgi:hypothetical protein
MCYWQIPKKEFDQRIASVITYTISCDERVNVTTESFIHPWENVVCKRVRNAIMAEFGTEPEVKTITNDFLKDQISNSRIYPGFTPNFGSKSYKELLKALGMEIPTTITQMERVNADKAKIRARFLQMAADYVISIAETSLEKKEADVLAIRFRYEAKNYEAKADDLGTD